MKPIADGGAKVIENGDYGFLENFYELLDIIGKGGFSVVASATHRDTGEICAIKILDKTSTAVRNTHRRFTYHKI